LKDIFTEKDIFADISVKKQGNPCLASVPSLVVVTCLMILLEFIHAQRE